MGRPAKLADGLGIAVGHHGSAWKFLGAFKPRSRWKPSSTCRPGWNYMIAVDIGDQDIVGRRQAS
jgi:hypothetical protein